MRILFNQQPLEVSATNLSDLSLELQLPTSGIAVAVNNRLVPRTNWQDFLLQDGMSILVIKAVCGGEEDLWFNLFRTTPKNIPT